MSEQNPNRLAGSPALGEPALGLSPVAVVERSPTGVALLGQTLVRIASIVGGLAVLAGGVFALFLPQPWAVTGVAICGSVALIATKIEAMGPGLRREVGTQPVTLAQPPAAPSAPRVGPPV